MKKKKKKKHKVLSIMVVAAMLVSMVTISAVSVSAEQHGSIKLEYNHTNPAANGGNPAGTGQTEQAQSNVKTGDHTASIAGGLSLAAVLSACTLFVIKKKKKAD